MDERGYLSNFLVFHEGEGPDSRQEPEEAAGDDCSMQQFKWTSNATKLLLDSYKKHKGEVGSLKVRNFKKMWDMISEDLNCNNNLKVTPGNCENRWRVLERNFKKYVDNTKKTGRGRKDFEFADEMFEILGEKRNICPELTLSTETILHLPEVERVRAEKSSLPGPAPAPGSSVRETSQILRKVPKKKLKSDILQEMRNDRREYYAKKLKLQEEKLEVQKQVLEERRQRNKLIEERNEILKIEKQYRQD